MMVNGLSGDDINGLSGDDINGLSGDDIHGLSGDDIHGLSGDDIHGLSGDDIHGLSGDNINGLSGDDINGLSGDDIHGLSGDDIHGLSGDDIHGLSGDDIHGLSGDDIHGLSGDNINGLSGDDINGLSGDDINEDVEVGVLYQVLIKKYATKSSQEKLIERNTIKDNMPTEYMEKVGSSSRRFNLKRKFDASELLLSAIDRGDHKTTYNIIATKVRTSTDSGHLLVNQGLVRAALTGDENMVSFLLTKEADIDYIQDNGITPLKAAIVADSYTTVETLLRCGAKVQVSSTHKVDSPLHLALKGGFISKPVNIIDRWDAKFLTDTKIIKLLIDNGASVNQRSSDGFLPLSLAASSNRDSVVSHLIKKGADVNQEDDEYSMTPLMHACVAGNVQIIKILLKKGADINATDLCDYSPLMLAAQYSRDRVVSTVLQDCADVNQISDVDGKNALIVAIECNSCDIVNTLLWYGANVNYSNPWYYCINVSHQTWLQRHC
ncbi:hypothetical protein Btru_072941 [Bulinus truncatus]|nr:hypothetical protein Btru_072941 [Bulinus truncatus]